MTPAPANSSDAAGPQWSRPASLLIFGVRPNSPIATTSVLASRPRWSRSSISAEKPWSNSGSLRFEAVPDLRVMVPAAVVDRDEPHAALDQPAGQQAALPERVAAIAVAQCGRSPARWRRRCGPRWTTRISAARLLELVVGRDLVVALHLLGQRVHRLQAAIVRRWSAWRLKLRGGAMSGTWKFAWFGSPVLNDS